MRALGAAGLATEADNLVETVSLLKLSQAEKQQQGERGGPRLATGAPARSDSPSLLLPGAS